MYYTKKAKDSWQRGTRPFFHQVNYAKLTLFLFSEKANFQKKIDRKRKIVGKTIPPCHGFQAKSLFSLLESPFTYFKKDHASGTS